MVLFYLAMFLVFPLKEFTTEINHCSLESISRMETLPTTPFIYTYKRK